MAANIFLIICTVVFLGAGIAALRFPEALVRVFRLGADTYLPERAAKKVYTIRNVRIGGYGYIGFSLLALGVLGWRLFNGFGFA